MVQLEDYLPGVGQGQTGNKNNSYKKSNYLFKGFLKVPVEEHQQSFELDNGCQL